VAAPVPVCPAGSPDDTTYECQGVTVTGAKDAEPTIALADGFAPVAELEVADVYVGEGDAVAPGATNQSRRSIPPEIGATASL